MSAGSNPRTYQRTGQGLEAAGGATATVLPFVGAGLSAAGLLSQLYGNYRAEQIARRNYRDQLREFEEDKAHQRDRERRQDGEQELQDRYSAKGAADSDMNGRLARYLGYYRQIGL